MDIAAFSRASWFLWSDGMEPGRERDNVSKRRGQARHRFAYQSIRHVLIMCELFFPCEWAWPFQWVRVETTTESILMLGSKVRYKWQTHHGVFPNEHKLQWANPTHGISKCAFRLKNKNHILRCLKCPSKDRAHMQLLGPWARFVKVFAKLLVLQHHASTECGKCERFTLCEKGQVGSPEVLIGLILKESAFL